MNSRILVKICGITRTEDAESASELGADILGMIFYPASKRLVSLPDALEIAEVARTHKIKSAGVFVNPSFSLLEETLQFVPLDLIQLHGNESPEFVEEVKRKFPEQKIIKALRLKTSESSLEFTSDFHLLDHPSAEWGGSGKAISWDEASVFVRAHEKPVFLAGGLGPENILSAIHTVNPYGVDLSSGVESSPGIKSVEKLNQLFFQLGRGSR
jgi:phosphoribosylanthranilate isomerase